MRKVDWESDIELLDYINSYRVDWDDESSLEDYVDECDYVIARLEELLDDDEYNYTKKEIEDDVWEVNKLKEEAEGVLNKMYDADDRYMELEYWNMVM